MPAQTTFKLRRGAASLWTSTNPVLNAGEPGLETDTNKVKYGDGVTAWNALDYASGGASVEVGVTAPVDPQPNTLWFNSETATMYIRLGSNWVETSPALVGPQGPAGATGPQGLQGPSGVISVSSPITNTGTTTSAVLGLNQSALSITASQVSDFTSAISGKLNSSGQTWTAFFDWYGGGFDFDPSNPLLPGQLKLNYEPVMNLSVNDNIKFTGTSMSSASSSYTSSVDNIIFKVINIDTENFNLYIEVVSHADDNAVALFRADMLDWYGGPEATVYFYKLLSFSISDIELGALDGVTSNIQMQLDAKAPVNNPTFLGNVSLPSSTTIGTVTGYEISSLSGVNNPIQSQLDARAYITQPMYDFASGLTLNSAGYKGGIIRSINSAITLTLDSTLQPGESIDFIQDGAGQITFAAGAGVTLQSRGSKFKTAGQYAGATVICVASGQYRLIGDLAA